MKDPVIIKDINEGKRRYGGVSGTVIVKDGVPYPTALFYPDDDGGIIYLETMDHKIDHINANPFDLNIRRKQVSN